LRCVRSRHAGERSGASSLLSQWSKTFLMGEQFTIADAYLFTVLSWGTYVKLDIDRWPQLKRYVERVGARPAVIEAFEAERLPA
jgi:glutathione S-transferase